MKLKLFVVSIFIFVSSFAIASDKNSDNLIKDIEAIKTIQSDFIQTNTIKGFGDDEYAGKLYIISKDKALWDYTSPTTSYYLFSKDGLEQYDELNNQLVRYKNIKASDNVLLQLLMDFSTIKSKFKISEVANKVTLIPLEDVGIQYLDITMSSNGKAILEMFSEDMAGNTTKIAFKKMVIDKPIDETIFKKGLPAGLSEKDIIELK